MEVQPRNFQWNEASGKGTLAPFLFLIVAEGLTVLVRTCIENEFLEPFSVGEGTSYPVLQFADDTLFLCTKAKENFWCLKAVMRIFELVSGLRVNFHKSCLVGISIDEEELNNGARFLYCNTASTPFKFLGVSVGANPRVSSTWLSVIKKMKNKLSTWRSRQLSMGGRITLINSVLASLPLYYFSFFKAPKKVIKEMVKIQRNFLWGGGEENKKSAWVRWSRVCLPKEKGGLGIRNMEVFNIALLGKWRWRMLVEKDNLWSTLLDSLYGEGGALNQSQKSLWWKDLQLIDECLSFGNNWFTDSVKVKMGDGRKVKFWQETWCSPWSLEELFPRLFELSADRQGHVIDFGEWIEERWFWRLHWAEELNEEEAAEARNLEELLKPIWPVRAREDRWCWTCSASQQFSVKSAYDSLIINSDDMQLSANERKILKKYWMTAAPSKFMVHGWRLLVDRLPTKILLQQRGILGTQQSTICAFCSRAEENSSHLFFSCSISDQLWSKVYEWCGQQRMDFNGAWEHLKKNGITAGGKKVKRIRYMVWVAAVWVIWINRNSTIFRGGEPNVIQMLNHVKRLSWGWIANRLGNNITLGFEEWENSPITCMNSLYCLSTG